MGDICRSSCSPSRSGAEYDDESLDPPDTVDPRATPRAALILRRRTNKGLVKIYETIVRQLQELRTFPAGFCPLSIDIGTVDRGEDQPPAPSCRWTVTTSLPLPVNDQQQR